MKRKELDRIIYLNRGERNYQEFCGLRYYDSKIEPMTPNTEVLLKMGKYKTIYTKGFIILALNELLNNHNWK